MATANNINVNMSIEQHLTNLKSRITTLAKQRDKAEWEMNRIKSELHEKFGLDSIEAAEAEANRLKTEAVELETYLKESINTIHEQYGDLLKLADTGAK
jgi:predicted  nucleic acid-binding Zn-ribbon protein